MADEIVPAEGPSYRPPRIRSRSLADYAPEPFDSEKIPPTLVSEVRRFLRVANQIEAESPRVAYICRFHAFEKAHNLDPKSSGRGVRQFKTALLQRLEQDEKITKFLRKEKSDARELRSFYKTKNMKAGEVSSVLHEVLKAVVSGAGPEFVAAIDIDEKIGSYAPYNILPIDPGSGQQSIMHLPEIEAAVSAVLNVRGLPIAKDSQEMGVSRDILEWLQCWFGFQKGNVANQREHLILLLANIHGRLSPKPTSMLKLDDRAVHELMLKIFENYRKWCKFLGRRSNILLPSVKQEIQQYKLLYIALYLLIWGEAANLRLMPECLCYIFHMMAYDLYGVLSGAIDLNTGEKAIPAYGGEHESFLSNVVTPIYKVIYEEAKNSKNGNADHSTWRNYDDLNEFFWSVDCFKIGWPMRLDNDFFYTPPHFSSQNTAEEMPTTFSTQKWVGKTNFVEIRSFWHLFRSFDRMWTFLVLALQVMIIMAWHDLETPLELLDPSIFEDILSIFVTNAVLRLMQVTLDIAFTWKARHTLGFYQKLRFALKFCICGIWTITLPTAYSTSQRNSVCSTKLSQSNLYLFCLSPYMIVVAIYLISNVLGMTLFFFPAVITYIEISNWRICKFLSWWAQPRLYVGRGMQEGQVSLLKYTIFWSILLFSKFLFSYHFEIKPLVQPTKQIMKVSVNNYDWHELFPKAKSNAGAILAVWTPVLLVYFMDTQIWYSIFCTIFGGVYGIVHHLGEIRTMGMVRSRFHLLPSRFNAFFVPHSSQSQKEDKGSFRKFLQNKIFKDLKLVKADIPRFSFVWNQIVTSFRSEDLISNRDMDLMIMPLSSNLTSQSIRWPLFLLTSKFSTAVNMTKEFVGEYEQLHWKINKDRYMVSAIKECYNSLKTIFKFLLVGDLEKRVLETIFDEIESSLKTSRLLVDFQMNELPVLHDKFIHLVELLFNNKPDDREKVVIILQDIVDILTKDMMVNCSRILDMINCSENDVSDGNIFLQDHPPELFASNFPMCAICFPLPDNGALKEQVKRIYLLLTVKEKAMDIPTNLEARRRISFFATSLFMDMPCAPKVRNMLSFSAMTPYYLEEIKFSHEELHSSQDGASILSYMQRIYPDEWENFLERLGPNVSDEEIRYWASFRGQTLSRTVRGMMYYRKALKLQAFLDRADDQDIYKRHTTFDGEQNKRTNQQSLSTQLGALADLKFTYVVSCQNFGTQKSRGDPHAQDIIDLMMRYSSLRVAYIEEKEDILADKAQKIYSSVLVKADNNLDQEIYRIKLPGPPIIGEGKPENQNHAIIFTRGEALQTIDMNQDNYLEEAYKIRNVLQEFLRRRGKHPPTIVGLREHIFTGSVSSLAGFMSYQETSFVTIGQRFLANPLRVRFHYGHPDLFDRLFHLTRGGVSKASKTINLSEDVFAGFNSTLRRGYITYKEYMQVGKGRDVGLNQISKFEAKVANGNSEQSLSRDIYRLGRRFDFFRMLSCYFTTVGFYFNSLISIFGLYVFLYGQLYLVLSGLEKALITEARVRNVKSLETALASQSFLQLGLLTGLPMVVELGLEKGIRVALSDFILMQLQLASIFFTFSLGTKAHFFGRTILHGGAKYRPTGRKFVVFHASFSENYQLYSRSHFVKGFELICLLTVYNLFRKSYQSTMAYFMITYSSWFMAGTWLFTPFLFNPSGFAWRKIVEDWMDWNKWMKNQGGIGIKPNKCWESWWNAEYSHLKHSGWTSSIMEILISLRFFIYQYGLVYHLDISQDNKTILVYVLSWFVIVVVFSLVKLVDVGRSQLSAKHHLFFRLFKMLLFLSVISCIIILSTINQLSFMDLFVCCLAFIPTGWGLLLISHVFRSKLEYSGLWNIIQVVAYAYDYAMGCLLFAPIAALAWMPVISAIQTRVLFNQAFNRQLHIMPILAGKSKHR
ncbi:putative callose synthase 8 isoform X2 [Zingiber officinale]|uniref:putative callose synthase 8 isoform X2 n=1 Tax=Zingiber officinale TaxID=94328 RepID=UPI001C4C46FD|nr:putative callose synthase 8 isoform X2 [Zingiber officinale]